MSRSFWVLGRLGTAIAMAGLTSELTAQGPIHVSAEVAGLGVRPRGDELEGWEDGLGTEAQLRLATGKLSLGLGFQAAWLPIRVFNVHITQRGLFAEPRFTFGSAGARVSPYLSARVARLRHRMEFPLASAIFRYTANGTIWNGGAGLLVGLRPTISLDLGVSFGRFRLDDGVAVSEPANGNPPGVIMGAKGTNTVVRLGIQFGPP